MQTGSELGYFQRGDQHPNIPDLFFHRYRKQPWGIKESWVSKDQVEKPKDYAKKYYEKNTEKERERGKKYYYENHKKELARYRKYNTTSRRRELEKQAYWANPEKFRHRKIQQYYKRKRNVIPLTAEDQGLMADIYQTASDLNLASISTGSKDLFEVDHIWPLIHKEFCGLHIPCNLQILARSENAQKSNKRPDTI